MPRRTAPRARHENATATHNEDEPAGDGAAATAGGATPDAVAALRRIAFLLERSGAQSYRSEAFRGAARSVETAGEAEVLALAAAGRLKDLHGVGERTAGVIDSSLRGAPIEYLDRLEAELSTLGDPAGPGASLRAALRGDLHSHTLASDGGSPLQEMVLAAMDLGHEYLTITDHSPRLTVANGLSPARLRAQLDQIAALNAALTSAGSTFRVLSGIEVDILDDGDLDQEPGLLAELDVVVASVHSKLRMESGPMTRRLLAAVSNPHTDVLGHCTGRQLTGKLRPQSAFDHAAVFATCADRGVAVEINCRPDRLDPPHELLQAAIDAGCVFSIDTDAHAPGQLDWQAVGCDRAAAHDLPADRVVNTWPAARLLDWAADHGRAVSR